MKLIALRALLGLLLLSGRTVLGDRLRRADSTGYTYFLAAKFQTGGILPTSPLLSQFAKNKPQLVQFDFSLLKNSQRSWENCGCYSRTGVAMSFADFGDNKLGKALNIFPFIEPYLFFPGNLQLSLRGGAGVSYLTKFYNPQDDPENLFYSTRMSFFMMMNVNVFYRLSPSIGLGLSAQWNHISNGGIHWPNYGINFPTAGLGLEYNLHPQPLLRRNLTPFTNRSLKLVTHLFGGRRSVAPEDPWPLEEGSVFGINAGLIKPIGRLDAMGFGGELYHDAVDKRLQQRIGPNGTGWIGAVSFQNYVFFGKMLFGQQFAYTLTSFIPAESTRLFQRYFLEYKIKSKWYAGVTMKVHGKKAEHLAATSGFVF